jgi:hypothetical protein
MQKLDAKFDGTIIKVRNGTVVPPDRYMVFLATDNAFPFALDAYIDACRTLDADDEQIEALYRARYRLHEWRRKNAHLCKTPDAADEYMLDVAGDREDLADVVTEIHPTETPFVPKQNWNTASEAFKPNAPLSSTTNTIRQELVTRIINDDRDGLTAAIGIVHGMPYGSFADER